MHLVHIVECLARSVFVETSSDLTLDVSLVGCLEVTEPDYNSHNGDKNHNMNYTKIKSLACGWCNFLIWVIV